MKDPKALRWPIGIALSFVLIIGLIYMTIVVSLDYPIEPSDRNMLYYHEYDKNVNDIILKKIAFDKKYDFTYVGKPISATKTQIKYKLINKNGKAIDNAVVKALITRPNENDYDIVLDNPKAVDGVYTFKSVSLPKEGRWNIIASVRLGDELRFLNLKADTRNPNTFEY